MVWTRAVLIMSVLGIVVVAVSAQSNLASSSPTETARANQTQETGTAAKGADSKADGDYVASDTCVTCHADQGRRFNKTTMGKAMARPHTPDEAHGCESCHGPGRTHVEAGGTKDTIPVRDLLCSASSSRAFAFLAGDASSSA